MRWYVWQARHQTVASLQEKWLRTMILRSKKNQPGKRAAAKGKVPSSSLHGRAVRVSVDERVSDLARRFPALHSALGSLLLEGKKRIRDLPAPDQGRLLRMVFALKKASGG